MKRNVKNDKVLRAMAIGLATMIAVTSTPVTVLAGEPEGGDPVVNNDNPTDQEETDQEETDPEAPAEPVEGTNAEPKSAPKSAPTVDSVGTDAVAKGNAADGQTKQIGEDAQKVETYKANVEQAVTDTNTLFEAADGVDKAVGRLLNDKADKPNSDGSKQIWDSEQRELGQEKAFGVTLDYDGQIVNIADADGFNAKVDTANGEISEAEDAKKTAYETLEGIDKKLGTKQDDKESETVYGKINKAEADKKKADDDTTAANNKKAESYNENYDLDSDTQDKLDNIAATLNNNVVEKDINAAIANVVESSAKAATVAGDNLIVVQGAFDEAQKAVTDATNNGTKYDRQYMENLKNKAQQAADNANRAAILAGNAVTEAQNNEKKAKDAVNNAQTALDNAQKDAVDVLQEYKRKIDEINQLISTANGSRKEAKGAMEKANAAIDAALKLMNDTDYDQTLQTANTKVLAMITAINEANDAIKLVADLVPDYVYKDDPKDRPKSEGTNGYHPYNYADKKYNDTFGRLKQQIDILDKAKTNYNNAQKATGTAAANQEEAEKIVNEINKIVGFEGELKDGELVGKVEGRYDRWEQDADKDINNLKALLTTNGQYTYQQLQDTANGTNAECLNKAKQIVGLDNSGEDDTNLTDEQYINKAEEIVKVYDEAVADNEAQELLLNGSEAFNDKPAVEGLNAKIEAQKKIITDSTTAENGLPGQIKEIQSDILDDQKVMKQKYAYDDDNECFITDEDGNLVYNQSYKILLAATDPENPDNCDPVVQKYVNVNDDEDSFDTMWLAMKPAVKDEEGNIYVLDYNSSPIGDAQLISGEKPEGVEGQKDGAPTHVLGTKKVNGEDVPAVFDDQVYFYEGYDVVEYKPHEDYYTQTTYNGKTIDGKTVQESDCFYRDPSGNDAVWEVMDPIFYYMYGWTGINIEYNYDKKTVEVKINNDDTEVVKTFKYDLNFTEVVEKSVPSFLTGNYEVKYTLKLEELKEKRYTERQEYDYNKYTLKDFGGGLNETALGKQKELQDLDKLDAEKGKGKYEKDLKKKADLDEELKKVRDARGDAYAELYGKNGTEASPEEGSLVYKKNEAETKIGNNNKIINKDGLSTLVSEYKTDKVYKQKADENLKKADDFDPDTAEGLSEDNKTLYNNAIKAKEQIQKAKKLAQTYQKEANEAYSTLQGKIKEEKDAAGKVADAEAKIEDAKKRLGAVKKKLDALKQIHHYAVGKESTLSEEQKAKLKKLNATSVDTNYESGDFSGDLMTLNTRINNELNALRKFDPDAYNALDFVHPEWMTLDVISISELSEKLAAAINTASGILESANKQLEEIKGEREQAESDYETIKELAKKTQDEADKAAKALANWKEPVKFDDKDKDKTNTDDGKSNTVIDNGSGTGTVDSSSSSDDDDDDDDYDESGSSSDAGSGSGSGTVIGTVASIGAGPASAIGADSITLTPVGAAGTAAGTGATGTGTGAGAAAGGRGAGVLGARNPEGNSDASGNNAAGNAEGKDVKNTGKDKTVVADANGNGGNGADGTNGTNGTNGSNGTKVADPTTPLNATPFSEEGTGFNWLWFVGAAAAAGAGLFGYNSRKKAAADRDEVKKYKKN